ncbi:glycosyltransferase family 4 protein [Aquihabitans sp. G128]|uniref:glycosyltransferase family 4 protein n=1 Tax=Aquihabitans sp. G128 TaxID=2849779 RepID=UPI001C22575D|nr:glycosyltransferase family 4 protein [Aquihabitans sp. G128]QXC62824.1 glycosyltransferase family 4 protein [Aquihabitans sp. G128]
MKLTFVVQRYGAAFVGGAEKYGRTMASGLAAAGHDVSVVTSCATSYEDWANVYRPGTSEDDGVTVHRFPVLAPRVNERFIPLHLRAADTYDVPLWPWAQERWAQTMGPDLVDVAGPLRTLAAASDATIFIGYHYTQTLWLTRVAASAGATVVIPTAHPEGAFHVGRVGQIFQHADRIICLAPEEQDLIHDTYGCGEKIDVVPCSVDDVARPSDGAVAAALARYGVERDRYAIVVGRVDPAKGSDDATRFAAEYRRAIDPSFSLVVVGPGGEGGPAVDGVVPTGFVDDATKDALVAGAAVLVQPSYMESFSLSLMEGWLLERPALIQARSRVLAGHAARSGGGLTYRGYLDFEAALATLLTRPDLARELGAKGRGYARREFDWAKVEGEFLSVAAAAQQVGAHRLRRQRSRTA